MFLLISNLIIAQPNVKFKNEYIISNFDGGVGVEWSMYTGASFVNDTLYRYKGTQSMKLTSASGVAGVVDLVKNFNFNGCELFSLLLYFDSSYSGMISVCIGHSGAWTDYYALNSVGAFTGNKTDDYVRFVFNKLDAIKTGNPDWGSINRIRIRFNLVTSQVIVVRLLQLNSYINPYSKGILCFTYDDNSSGVRIQQNDTLNKYGLGGATNFIIPGWDTFVDSNIVRWKYLQKNYNWIIANHSLNHYSMDTLDSEKSLTQIRYGRDSLDKYGFNGKDFLAYPYGYRNPHASKKVSSYISVGLNLRTDPLACYNYYPVCYGYNIWTTRYNTASTTNILRHSWIDSLCSRKCVGFSTQHDYATGEMNLDTMGDFCRYVKTKVDAGQLTVMNLKKFKEYEDSLMFSLNRVSGGLSRKCIVGNWNSSKF
jgi:peptidoglycan/xylan/chitin deacetylase (PgdA/CDA1 family)